MGKCIRKAAYIIFSSTLLFMPLVTSSLPAAALSNITEYYITTGNSSTNHPGGIVAGSDGALWFTNSGVYSIGSVTTAGYFSSYAAESNGSITSGPDGALWFTESNSSKIARMTTAGSITEFPVLGCTSPSSSTGSCWPYDITSGPDGALWFTEAESNVGNNISRITTSGNVTTYNLPYNIEPFSITSGSDGALWFTASSIGNSTSDVHSVIGRITTSGRFLSLHYLRLLVARHTLHPAQTVLCGSPK